MLIRDLKHEHPSAFTGVYRIREPFRRLATNGSVYHACHLEDYSGTMKAIAWPERYHGPTEFKDLECVEVTGKVCTLRHGVVIHIHKMATLKERTANSIALIPQSICPIPILLDRLQETVMAVGSPVLQDFVSNVLADDSICFPFVSLPASGSHHHSHGGGLLEHSLACASMMARYNEFPTAMLELGIVGALFHDVGKIKTVGMVGGRRETAGYVLDHDDLTLEVLASHLKKLDSVCMDAGVALRYIWTWRRGKSRSRIPIMTVAEAVALSDRVSAGLDVERQVFQDRPDWQRFARFNRAALQWRPNLKQLNGENRDNAGALQHG